jgi:hypothetical protein
MTTDKDYADLLVRLAAVPAQQPERRSYTQAQERAHLVEDLTAVNGEAPW